MVDDLERALVRTPRPGLVVVLWRWRWETLVLTGSGLAIWSLVHGLRWIVAGAVVAAITVGTATACATWRVLRHELVARAMCLVTPHRLRVGCVQARIHSRRGKLPMILWTSPAAYGERVLVWCRAGTTPADFVAARETLAAACWAADVLTTPSPRHRHLVIVEVIRRPEHTGELTDRRVDMTRELPPQPSSRADGP